MTTDGRHIVTPAPPFPAQDFTDLEARLGLEPIGPLDGIDYWSITVDRRVHTPSWHWLKIRSLQSKSTAESSARNLAKYIDFLVNERDLFDADERYSDVLNPRFGEDDLLAMRKHYLDHGKRTQWNSINSTITNFHLHIKNRLKVELPFTLQMKVNQHGRAQRTNGLGAKTHTGTSGTPLTPEKVEILLQGVERLDRDFEEHDGPAMDRDRALINHALATGMRRESLVMTTIHEVPPEPRAGSDFVINKVADETAKNKKGGHGLAFEHRLKPVRTYIREVRPELVEASKKHHRPERPLRLTEANATWWSFVDQETGEIRKKFPWAATGADMRRRIVGDDGSSPLVHLTMLGTPLDPDTASQRVQETRDWILEHLDRSFPNFRLHDCRHTFAVHLALCIYHDRVRRWMDEASRAAYAPGDLVNALAMVQASLGHTTQSTTQLYLTHAQLQLDIDPDRFLGRREVI